MSFDLETFVAAPTVSEINGLTKANLLAVALHYKLSTTDSMTKTQLKKLVLQYLQDEEILSRDSSSSEPAITGEELLELRRLEMQEKDREREAQLRLKEIELKEKELQVRLKELEVKSSASHVPVDKLEGSVFDVSKHIRFVPTFSETEVDKYFLHFEKVACSLKWPKDSWTLLLQSILVGKAREAYAALTIEESSQYHVVKAAVLKAYELVPEAYRQKFRNAIKRSDQTFVEFAREKERLFNRWCSSREIDNNFDKLRQLLLIEEFKKCLPNEVKTYLDEKKAETLSQAATLADDYVLTHKKAYSRLDGRVEPFVPASLREGSDGHKVNPGLKDSSLSQPRPLHRQGIPNGPKCYHCHKRGHVMADCWHLKKSPQTPSQKPKGHLMTVRTSKKHQPGSCSSQRSVNCSIPAEYHPFISKGRVCLPDSDVEVPITILRDTGANQTLILEGVLPFSKHTSTGDSVLIQGVEVDPISVPLHKVTLLSDFVSGVVTVGVRPSLPVVGVALILGNDLAGGKVVINPCVTHTPTSQNESGNEEKVYPACAVTRAMARKMIEKDTMESTEDEASPLFTSEQADDSSNDTVNKDSFPLSDTFLSHDNNDVMPHSQDAYSSSPNEVSDSVSDSDRDKLCSLQKQDPNLAEAWTEVVEDEDAPPVCYFVRDGMLMRRWRPLDARPDDDWRVVEQIVLPKHYHREVLHLAHESPLAGHLGVNKTYRRVLQHFFWPGLKNDVKLFCKSCHICQIVGKPNQSTPVAPLKPIPVVGEPFSQVIIDCVGPLPKSKAGNQYLLTIMCASTRFPEAIPLRNIKAKTILKPLIKFFTLVGLPKTVQSDQGSNFMAGVFQQVLYQLGIKQNVSSAYHPESQGALERFHQTLKNMLRAYCLEQQKDWDEGLPMLLFAVRESVQESLGFSPFELLYGREVRGPLRLMKECWLTEDEPNNLLDQVSNLRHRLMAAREIAKTNLVTAQDKMKVWYDRRAKERSFEVGDEVLALIPIPGDPLRARFSGPYVVHKKLNDVDYIIKTPERRKQQRLCHVNMLKFYHRRTQPPKSCATMTTMIVEGEKGMIENGPKLSNSSLLSNLGVKLDHLSGKEQSEMEHLLLSFKKVFGDMPSCTTCCYHDVDVGDSPPIKQHPYRMNPIKLEQMRKEIEYMLENHIIEPSNSDWSSPSILVPKPDGTLRFCTDFRKLNSVTKTDSFPLPRIEDCIDRVGRAKYVTKFDLLKGYWQIPLTDRARRLSAFATPDGLYQYCVMPFGMKNAPATFQRMINKLLRGVNGCEAYMDDVVVHNCSWEEHLASVEQVLTKFADADLTVNLAKSEIGHAQVTFLGHVVGGGTVKPLSAKVQAVTDYPPPANKKELMRFLGMAGYYRRFCRNFSVITVPLTNLLKKDEEYVWCDSCQAAFTMLKSVLLSNPVLLAPDFMKQFILMVDASSLGAGSVLMQSDSEGVEHPVCYFSHKFDSHQRNYSTIEQETLALVLSLKHFDVYLNTTLYPILVYTDHNPLTFINKMKNHNQRLLRWGLVLQEYDLIIKHVKGKENVIADALSRLPDE